MRQFSGRTFLGTIQGIGDPNKRKLLAVVQGIPVINTSDSTVTTLNFHADGSLNATVKRPSSSIFATAGVLLSGTASVEVTESGSPISDTDFVVDGFLQSTTVTLGTG